MAITIYRADEIVGEIKAVISCNITRKLNGECMIDVSTMSRLCDFAQIGDTLEIGSLIFVITGLKRSISSGIYVTALQGEHISYGLNDYTIEELSFSGGVADCLAAVLDRTPFKVGAVDVESSVELLINKSCSRRDALMQLAALCGGEIEYDGYKIGIRKHLGSDEPVQLLKDENVSDISVAMDSRSATDSYSISLFKRVKIAVGDEVRIKFTPLGIDTLTRVVGLTWNPFNPFDISLTVGAYQAEISDSLYQLSEQMSTMETNMLGQMDAMEASMMGQMDAIESGLLGDMDLLETDILGQLGDLDTSLSTKIDDLAQKVNSGLYAIKSMRAIDDTSTNDRDKTEFRTGLLLFDEGAEYGVVVPASNTVIAKIKHYANGGISILSDFTSQSCAWGEININQGTSYLSETVNGVSRFAITKTSKDGLKIAFGADGCYVQFNPDGTIDYHYNGGTKTL